MGSKPDDGSQIKSLIATKDNEIANLKKQLKIPNVHPVQTVEIKQVQNKKEELLAIIVKYKGLTEEKEKKISDLLAQIVALKTQSATSSQTVPLQTYTLDMSKQVQVPTEVKEKVQEPMGQPRETEVVDVEAMEEEDTTLELARIEEDKENTIKSLEEDINQKNAEY